MGVFCWAPFELVADMVSMDGYEYPPSCVDMVSMDGALLC